MAQIEARTSDLGTSEASQVDFSFKVSAIALVLAAGFLLRLFLASLPGFGIDLGSFEAWSRQLADHGPWDFYNVGFFADYTPGYLYILWFIGLLDQVLTFGGGQFEYVLKLPAVFADVGSAYLLYRMLKGQRLLFRLGAPALYLIFPATLMIGPVWGQVDSILAFFLLLTVYYVSRGQPVRGALAFTVGFLVKPQAVAALPFLAFWYLKSFPLSTVMRAAAISLAASVLIILPFFPDGPWQIVGRLADAADVENYRVTSFWAYNFWGLFDLFKPDNIQYLGFSYRAWGFFLFALAMALVILTFWRSQRDSAGLLALGIAVSVLAFYLFLTRMHERYLFPFFLPFLAASVLIQSRLLWTAFIGLGVIHFFNLYYVYSYYPFYLPRDGNPVEPFARPLFDWVEGTVWTPWGTLETVFLLSLLATLAFPLLLLGGYLFSQRRTEAAEVS